MNIYWHDVELANREIDKLKERNAFLERMAKDMGSRCVMRWRGQCDLDCLGRAICDVEHLRPIKKGPRRLTRALDNPSRCF